MELSPRHTSKPLNHPCSYNSSLEHFFFLFFSLGDNSVQDNKVKDPLTDTGAKVGDETSGEELKSFVGSCTLGKASGSAEDSVSECRDV